MIGGSNLHTQEQLQLATGKVFAGCCNIRQNFASCSCSSKVLDDTLLARTTCNFFRHVRDCNEKDGLCIWKKYTDRVYVMMLN